jgi:glucose-6-phosphate-specific signal transduction histidine kinase
MQDRTPDVPKPDVPAHSASTGDAAEAIGTAIARLHPVILHQRVRIEVAADTGLLVRTRAATLADLVSDLLNVGLHAVPGGRLLFTAYRHAGRIDITLSDDGMATDAALRLSQVRDLEQRVALLGGSLAVVTLARHGTTMTLRLAGALNRTSAATEPATEAWPEAEPQLL